MNSEQFTAWLAEQYSAGTPVIVVYPFAEETTEQVAAQPLRTAAGTNIVSWMAEVSGTTKEVVYMGEDPDTSNKVGVCKVGFAKAG